MVSHADRVAGGSHHSAGAGQVAGGSALSTCHVPRLAMFPKVFIHPAGMSLTNAALTRLLDRPHLILTESNVRFLHSNRSQTLSHPLRWHIACLSLLNRSGAGLWVWWCDHPLHCLLAVLVSVVQFSCPGLEFRAESHCWMADMQPPQPQPWEHIGQAFIGHYYRCFDGDRAQLAPLYVSHQPQTITAILTHTHTCSKVQAGADSVIHDSLVRCDVLRRKRAAS